MAYTRKIIFGAFVIFSFLLTKAASKNGKISVSNQHMKMQVNQLEQFYLSVKNLSLDENESLTIEFVPQHHDILRILPTSVEIIKVNFTSFNYTFTVHALSSGKSDIIVVSSPKIESLHNLFLNVEIYEHYTVEEISNFIGWVYFVSWAASYYPQLYTNFKRKSVVGLNFDFLAFNIIGYTAYAIFNLGLYYHPGAKEEYFKRHPRSLNPVLPNDLLFVIHGTCAAIFTGIQALIYERKEQKLSLVGQGMCGMYGLAFFVSLLLLVGHTIHLLDFLYVCSFIKLVVTVTKYVPQVYMNYTRKSTEGWSIGNVILDFIGGIGSLVQMFLNAYNYNDPHSVIENPTKFGLAVLTIIFDVIFICQHYVLYKKTESVEYDDTEGVGSKEAFLKDV